MTVGTKLTKSLIEIEQSNIKNRETEKTTNNKSANLYRQSKLTGSTFLLY